MFWNLFKSSKEKIGVVVEDALKSWQNDINFLQSMQKLEVKEGDIIVLRHPCRLSEQASMSLKAHMEGSIKSFGFNVKVIVLEEDMNIGVLTKEIKNRMSI